VREKIANGGSILSYKIEEKFNFLINDIQAKSKIMNEANKKAANKRKVISIIQIILATITTILLGLKLGEIGQSIALIVSAISTGLTSWYNIQEVGKRMNYVANYAFRLSNLAHEIIFYTINNDSLVEEDLLKYTKMYVDLRNQFGEEVGDLLKGEHKKKELEVK
jgi:hypothetical protein